MIIPNKKLLFVHIPKTGGQSITKYLFKDLGIDFKLKSEPSLLWIINNEDRRLPGPEKLAHLTYDEYVDLGYLSQEDFDSYSSFSVVRNPYSRFVSAFYYNGLQHVGMDKWIQDHFPSDRNSHLYRHFMPQHEYIASRGDIKVDRLFYTENLDNDFLDFAHAYGYTQKYLDRINRISKKDSNIKNLTPYARDWIQDYYRKDFEIFNYEME